MRRNWLRGLHREAGATGATEVAKALHELLWEKYDSFLKRMSGANEVKLRPSNFGFELRSQTFRGCFGLTLATSDAFA